MKKTGILGGTFNPIHNVHIAIAREAINQQNLSEVLVMPTFVSPNKLGQKTVDFDKRYEMVKLALSDEKNIYPSDFEFKRKNISYTSDTVALLNKEFTDTEFYLIMGGDSVMYLEKWHEPQVIFDNCRILYACREGSNSSLCKKHIENVLIKKFDNVNVTELDFKISDLSSTSIRDKIKRGCRNYKDLEIKPKVLNFIVKEGLYM